MGVLIDLVDDLCEHFSFGTELDGPREAFGKIRVEPHLHLVLVVNADHVFLNREEPAVLCQLSKAPKCLVVEVQDIGVRHILDVAEPHKHPLQVNLPLVNSGTELTLRLADEESRCHQVVVIVAQVERQQLVVIIFLRAGGEGILLYLLPCEGVLVDRVSMTGDLPPALEVDFMLAPGCATVLSHVFREER